MWQYNQKIRNVLMPDRIAALPISEAGFPVPWFVHWVSDQPDFRVIGRGKLVKAVKQNRCWVCGNSMGSYKAFILGPMCIINRTISEPPSHHDCATFSALACPFLANPRMRRNEAGMDDANYKPAGGMAIKRNPGATAVWTTRSYQPFNAPGGVLFRPGDPTRVEWYASGRHATRAEVEASIASGLPLLQAEADKEGPAASLALAGQVAAAQVHLPLA